MVAQANEANTATAETPAKAAPLRALKLAFVVCSGTTIADPAHPAAGVIYARPSFRFVRRTCVWAGIFRALAGGISFMALHTLSKRNWLLIGGLIILSAGMIEACTHPTEKPTPVVETIPVVAKPEAGISEETISTELESETEPTSQPSQPEESEETEKECYKDPREALDRFLSSLYHHQYEKAAKLYAGDYETLEDYNLDVDPQNRPKLLERWCEVNVGTCLKHEILGEEVVSENEFIFCVQFFWEDGTIMAINPPNREPQNKFGFRVVEMDNCCRVMGLPPFSP